jgi:hypothetical protein
MQSLIKIVAIISCLSGTIGTSMAGETQDRNRAEAPVPSSPARAPAFAARPSPSTPMPDTQAASYAGREEAATELQQFKGGASISVTLGTTALIVLAAIVVLVILL